jgi:hypothetical protein
MASETRKKAGTARPAAGSKRTLANEARTSDSRGAAILSLSHPMILVNLDDDRRTRTVWVGKDKNKLKQYVVRPKSFAEVDIDPD